MQTPACTVRMLPLSSYCRLFAGIVPAMLPIVFASGCHTSLPPSVTLQGVSLVDSSDVALRYDIALQITNPNPEALPLREAKFSVSANGNPVFSTRSSAEATAPPGATALVRIPCVVPVTLAGQQVQVMGTLQYFAPGALAEALFDTGVRKPEQPFSFAVELPPMTIP